MAREAKNSLSTLTESPRALPPLMSEVLRAQHIQPDARPLISPELATRFDFRDVPAATPLPSPIPPPRLLISKKIRWLVGDKVSNGSEAEHGRRQSTRREIIFLKLVL